MEVQNVCYADSTDGVLAIVKNLIDQGVVKIHAELEKKNNVWKITYPVYGEAKSEPESEPIPCSECIHSIDMTTFDDMSQHQEAWWCGKWQLHFNEPWGSPDSRERHSCCQAERR